MNELRQCIKKYRNYFGNIYCYQDDPCIDTIKQIYVHLDEIQCDCDINSSNKGNPPDGYFIVNDVCYIVEHFSFDSSRHNRKGSALRIKNNNINKAMEKISAEDVFRDEISMNCTAVNLKDSFIKSFNEHSSRICGYKENLIDKKIINDSFTIKYLFVCEDTSIVGEIAYENNVYTCVLPININECWKEIIKSKVDYFLFLSPFNDSYLGVLISKEYLMLGIVKHKKAENIIIYDGNLKVIGKAMRIKF